jgi:hypothetical protein
MKTGNPETTLTEENPAAVVRVSSASDGRGRPLDALIGRWAAHESQIRRIWVRGGHAANPLLIALELQPVGDSEETAAIWLARSSRWRAELESAVGRAVELEWCDADESPALGAAKADTLVFERGR